ncbi:hypothetical protein J1N35_016709 [Gossypium stocksii]|uniref:Uncharacterized protein n=1 Tax=Gossypium stocksii TaxID=47602 RepID=A0A9D4A3D1_9ROSI|nr:hypothetical protein J1N35_016709 [Gossypium stocksii]
MGLNKFGCFITAMVFMYAMLISQAFSARVRLMDREGFPKVPVSDNVVASHQNVQVSALAGGYKSPDSDKNVVKTHLRLPGKPGPEYRPLVLNLLPKGTLPPSGPSKRKNSFS